MAFSFTVVGVEVLGNVKMVHGTFTTADGDSSGTLTASTHGLNYIVAKDISFQAGGVNTPNPKLAVSSGTITITCDDTQGYSGTWSVIGK